MSRVAALLAVALAAALAVTLLVAVGRRDGPPVPVADASPRCAGRDAAAGAVDPARTEFGFVRGPDVGRPGTAAFRDDVDLMAAHGQRWIRIRVASWAVVSGGTGTQLEWNPDGLRRYDDALDYARRRGLKVYLVTTGPPDWTRDQPFDSYVRTAAEFWRVLAERYAQKVGIWQFFNEADGSHYRFYDDRELGSDAYLAGLARLLDAGCRAVRAVAPGVAVTTSAKGWPVDDATQARWFRFFDALHGNLDLITVDVYAGDDDDVVEDVGRRVAAVRARYGVGVVVGETGLPTCPDCATEAKQASVMPKVIDRLKDARPVVIMYFAFRDSGPDREDGEQTFGVVTYDGRRKRSFDAVVAALR